MTPRLGFDRSQSSRNFSALGFALRFLGNVWDVQGVVGLFGDSVNLWVFGVSDMPRVPGLSSSLGLEVKVRGFEVLHGLARALYVGWRLSLGL